MRIYLFASQQLHLPRHNAAKIARGGTHRQDVFYYMRLLMSGDMAKLAGIFNQCNLQ